MEKVVEKKVKGEEIAKSTEKSQKNNKKDWEKPTLEDVSSKVMAQPYIRFT